ncbi:MAG: small subunit ribosomal protein S13 [archaeon GW2011_AR5]|nr:MAG: small subunit ribosomal protein S13 [archaeon GW2011_AR5]
MAEAPKQETQRRIVRVMTTDIDGSLSVERALRKIKGVSFMFSKSVCTATGIDRRKKIGLLSEAEVKTIEGFIKKPQLPKWMLNRRKEPENGDDAHLTMADLDFRKREDINTLRRIRAYKGIRHELGQPVRGQRTRSSFRTQKTVGVSRKSIQQASKPKPKEEKK